MEPVRFIALYSMIPNEVGLASGTNVHAMLDTRTSQVVAAIYENVPKNYRHLVIPFPSVTGVGATAILELVNKVVKLNGGQVVVAQDEAAIDLMETIRLNTTQEREADFVDLFGKLRFELLVTVKTETSNNVARYVDHTLTTLDPSVWESAQALQLTISRA